MSYTVQMPALGESVTEGTVTRWLKQVGEHVQDDEPLLEVSTDKVDTEIPSPQAGTLHRIVAGEDETVEVGGDLAVIEPGGATDRAGPAATGTQTGASLAAPVQERPSDPQLPAQPGIAEGSAGDEVRRDTSAAGLPNGSANTDTEIASLSSDDDARAGSPYATPLVRKFASERGVDLSAVAGTGAGGRIRKQDVEKVVAERQNHGDKAVGTAPPQPRPETPAEGVSGPVQRPVAPPSAASQSDEAIPGTKQKMSQRRVTIAKRMVESLQVSAQLTTVVEVDLTRVARLRERAKDDFQRREGVKLSFLPFMALATIKALKAHPGVNASVDVEQGEITYHGAEHLGVAVDSPAGLLVPVIPDAGNLNLGGLARKIADVADRTRENEIAPDELSGGTFTITNTGSRGALIDTPIINQPQVGILGTGAVVKKPAVVTDAEGGDSFAVRSMSYLSLSYDHRIVDGADAARFLNTVKSWVEAGAFEVDLGL